MNTLEKRRYKTANIISLLANAPIVALPAFLLINLHYINTLKLTGFIITETLCILFGTIFPILLVLFWSKYVDTDPDISNKEDRPYPLLIGAILYFIGAIFLHIFNAPAISICLIICYGINTFAVLLITFFWKISIHAIGTPGPTTGLMTAYNPYGAILGLILPLVMWSRVKLEKHTINQVISGATLGFILTIPLMKILLSLYGITLNTTPIIFYSISLISIPIILTILGYTQQSENKIKKLIIYPISLIYIIIFCSISPLAAKILLILSGLISIIVTCFAGDEFLWYKGLKI